VTFPFEIIDLIPPLFNKQISSCLFSLALKIAFPLCKVMSAKRLPMAVWYFPDLSNVSGAYETGVFKSASMCSR
jgi:hypothetical protein